MTTMKSLRKSIQNFYSSRYGLHALVLLMSLSLAGIGVVQWLWIDSVVKVREEKYEERVRTSLETIIQRLERKKQVVFIRTKAGEKKIIDGRLKDNLTEDLSSIINQPSAKGQGNEPTTLDADIKIIRREESEDLKTPEEESSKHKNQINYSSLDSFLTDSNKQITHIHLEKKEDLHTNMTLEFEKQDDPVEKRINLHSLDEIVIREVQEKALGDGCEYALWNSKTDSILFQSDGFQPGFIEKSYRATLFPEDFEAKDDFLLLYLPDKNKIVLHSMALLLSGSIIFTLIIVVIFFITARFASKQKKISRIKSDFINNMTHEFKTPIATISLATDAIKNPKVIHDVRKIEKFVDIIKEENQRMNKQVERTLQMALLEKEDLEFKGEHTDLNALTAKAIQIFELKMNEKRGRLVFIQDIAKPTAYVDEVHFLNVVHNLLDNAVKYSSVQPDIRVELFSSNDQVHLLVKDKGIGIRKENQQKIFEKFFREATGDIHNVKGFGLGLSYVKAVVKAFGGQVQLSSTPGKGSTFEIILPKITEHNGK
jgi:signal transduction histidine kinase